MSETNPYAPPVTPVEIVHDQNSSIPSPANYASRWLRLGGAIIDGIVALCVGGVIGFFLGVFVPGILTSEFTLTVIVFIAYMAVQFPFWKSRAQSIGKIVTGTQIVKLDGEKADVVTIAFKRYSIMSLLGVLPVIGGVIGLVNALCIFREEHNCLHDDVAGTRVVMLKKSH